MNIGDLILLPEEKTSSSGSLSENFEYKVTNEEQEIAGENGLLT